MGIGEKSTQAEAKNIGLRGIVVADSTISRVDANWASLPMIPAGAAIRTLGYSGYQIDVEIDGRRMRLGLDYGRRQPIGDWAKRMIVTTDPKPGIVAWPARIRTAVRDGRIAIGMTKEQVIVSVGYPPGHATPSLDAIQWKYWKTTTGTYLVVWDESERVRDVFAEPDIRAAVLAPDRSDAESTVTELAAGLPGAGAMWRYRFEDRLFSRNSTTVTIRASRVLDPFMEEVVVADAGPSRGAPARREFDAHSTHFLETSLGRTALVEFAPYLLATRGPVGWNESISPQGYPVGQGGMPPWVLRTEPIAWEQVTVPAGSFRAARVEITGTRAHPVYMRGESGRFRVVVWYAPEVKRFIRLEHESWASNMSMQGGDLMSHEVVELVAYKLSPS